MAKRFEEIRWVDLSKTMIVKKIDWLLSCAILRSNIKIPRSIVKIPVSRIYRVINVENMIGDRG